jgi:hypothetical protein
MPCSVRLQLRWLSFDRGVDELDVQVLDLEDEDGTACWYNSEGFNLSIFSNKLTK